MMMSLCKELRLLLQNAIDCDTILLGGLDSSILAVLGMDKIKYAITIAYNDAPDLEYAKLVAEKCKFKHIIRYINDEELLDYTREIVRIMHIFDPMEIRNSIVLYASMLEAKSNGMNCIITGDGSDELFAGYNYMLRFDYERLEQELNRLLSIMHFSSLNIGEELGIRVSMPYLTNEVISIARSIPIDLKVREHNNIRYGKWILRDCFKDLLGEKIAFRKKMAMEEGSGLDKVRIFDEIMDDDEYSIGVEDAKEEGVVIRSKEHLYYYKIFREEHGIPKMLFKRCNFRCPDCLSYIDIKARYCRVCGAFPVKPMRIS